MVNATERAVAVTGRLCDAYPDRRPLLNYDSPFQLAIAVILSAQTTDAQVNLVTPELFARFPTPADLAIAPVAEVEQIVRSTGFYRNKAKSIVGAAKRLHEEFHDTVPGTMAELTSLPGMGRKSANVILGVVYGEPAIVVDTHLTRVTSRLGLVSGRNPEKIERELKAIVPADLQTDFSMAVNLHGRYRCYARKPDCAGCEVRELCPWPDAQASLEAGAEVGE
ncbi:MAG: endonuclease III [Spirochaetota bacterium]